MKYTFQHYVDISTSADSITVMQISAGGEYTMNRIKHLLPAFKYVKYGKVSVKLLPASTLPVDPLGLSYDDDDPQTVDPRDQMNPGLVRITNGEDIMTDFTGLSDDYQQAIYTNTMLDPRWSKFMLQSGFKRSAVPLYWNVGQLRQDPYPGSVVNVPVMNTAGDVVRTSAFSHIDVHTGNDNVYATGYDPTVLDRAYSDPRGFFQTGHRGRMGWMPTDAFYETYDRTGWTDGGGVDLSAPIHKPMWQPLPEINVITVVLPKAYKTKYYYRMFVTETVYLAGIKNSGVAGDGATEYRAIDNFIYAAPGIPSSPGDGRSLPNIGPDPFNTGGGL